MNALEEQWTEEEFESFLAWWMEENKGGCTDERF